MKNILKEYFPIAAIIISFVLAAVIGGYFTSINMDWYFGLNLPSFTPPGSVIGMVWTGIYILVSMSALFYFLKVRKDKEVFALFIINAILNLS